MQRRGTSLEHLDLRRSQRILGRQADRNLPSSSQPTGLLLPTTRSQEFCEITQPLTLPENQSYHRQNDISDNVRQSSVRSNSSKSSVPVSNRTIVRQHNPRDDTSRCSSNLGSKSTTSTLLERRRLEIQIEFAKKKEEAKLRVLELQEQLELARLEEAENDRIDEAHVNYQGNQDNQGDVANWVNNIDVANGNDFPEAEQHNNNLDQREGRNQQQLQNYRRQIPEPTEQPRIRQIENWISRQSINKDLPKFSGNPLEWPQFITQFRNTTELCNLTNSENQMRLQKSLIGQALTIVQPLLIYPDNVNRVIEILERRFGRSHYIITLLLERVRQFQIIKEEKLNSLVEFFDVFSNLVYTLESLDQEDHIRNPILFQEVLSKLPIRLKVEFIQYLEDLNSYDPPIIIFHKWLERKVSAVSHLIIPSTSQKIFEEKSDSKAKTKALTFSITDNNQPEISCAFCTVKGHSIIFCNKFKNLDVNDRWQFVTKNRFCFCCLKGKHPLKFCKQKKSCTQLNCKKPHHPLLHKVDDVEAHSVISSPSCAHNPNINTNCHIHDSNYALLKIIPVILKGPNAEIKSFALLDEGSTVSLLDAGLAQKLGLEGPTKSLRLQWTNNQFNEHKNSQIVSVSVKGINTSSKMFTLRQLKTVDDLSLPTQSVDVDYLSQTYSYLNSFKNLSYFNAQPMLIIGQDNWPIIVSRKITHGLWNGPTVSKTLLGWVIHGNISSEIDKSDGRNNLSFHIYEVESKSDEKDDLNIIQDLIRQQWSFDINGTTPSSGTDLSLSVDDKRCLKILDETMKRVENGFECGLFWKNDIVQLTESKATALKRLKSLEQKMDKNQIYADAYVNKMNEYISKGYIKKLSQAEGEKENSKTWYLPHFGVVNPNKPTKLRIVFDAAAKSNGYCLNDYLLTGPDLYNSLPDILMNFRTHKIAFIGDIKEMFLQILVTEKDKSAQRILWRGMDRKISPEVYEIQVVFFGATCSPSIAQSVITRNAKENEIKYPQACKAITNNHYMDDYLGGADTDDEAIQLVHDTILLHKIGGFQICNWVSNSKTVLATIDNSLKADSAKQEFSFDSSNERVLGVWWNFAEDVFSFKFKFSKVNEQILTNNQRPTKRDILKIVMSIFDPLGFLSNIIIVGKILMQSIWESGIIWDDLINDSQYAVWKNWFFNLTNLNNLKIPRMLTTFNKTESTIDLHVFCDASEFAYAAVAYLRFEHNNDVDCRLLNSKARVAPLKPTSIPRLELQAALLGARLSHSIKNSLTLEINSLYLWSDSKTVLHWIKSSSRRYKTFVAQRIGEIHDLSDPSIWNYVPSKLNIADDATKSKPVNFSCDSQWFRGPPFLYKHSSEWPKFNNENIHLNDDSEEVKTEYLHVIVETENLSVPEITRFSNWTRYVRSTAWVLKAIEIFRRRNDKSVLTYELLPEDMAKAKNLVYRKIQFDSFKNEIEYLKSGKSIPKSSSLHSFSCFLDNDNILRIKGRINNSSLHYESKSPIILSHKHALTRLLVQHIHNKNNHVGTETIIADLRKLFWITNLRSLVKKCRYECQHCRILKSIPQIPPMGQLPKCRVEKSARPFLKCGVDYFGPIHVTVGRRHEKRYGVIFTCMSMRAIHLELAYDLSFDSFMHVLTQFGSRRGFPEELYSDNGTNFQRAAKEIKEAIKTWPQEELVRFCTMKECKWFFNPPIAPHMGGVWERMIRSVKTHLQSMLKDKYPREYVLKTLLCEIEFIINSRPLTYNSNDFNDADPLTPNDLLIGASSKNFPLLKTNDKDLTHLSMWRAAQRLADIFWKRWVNEYLPTILHSKKWTKASKNLMIGDLVLIVDSDNPRNCWPRGRVVQTFPAKDGYVRVVEVETLSGRFRRSVSKIVKLNIFDDSNSHLVK